MACIFALFWIMKSQVITDPGVHYVFTDDDCVDLLNRDIKLKTFLLGCVVYCVKAE